MKAVNPSAEPETSLLITRDLCVGLRCCSLFLLLIFSRSGLVDGGSLIGKLLENYHSLPNKVGP